MEKWRNSDSKQNRSTTDKTWRGSKQEALKIQTPACKCKNDPCHDKELVIQRANVINCMSGEQVVVGCDGFRSLCPTVLSMHISALTVEDPDIGKIHSPRLKFGCTVKSSPTWMSQLE